MTVESTTQQSRIHPITWLGLFIALFGLLVVRQAVSFVWPAPTFPAAVWKESLIWICAIALLVIVKCGEGLPFSSIGIGTSKWWKSLSWGIVLATVCLAVAAVLVALTHFNGGSTGEAFSKLPLWLVTLIVVRAGVVEELCYRGYAIERLNTLGLNRSVAAGVALLIFGIGHWTGGWANIVIALVLGAILAGFYLWKRDLVANMIAHFLVDFAANVLPHLFS
jgi:membrane protease YdiL (CAAX protease family)